MGVAGVGSSDTGSTGLDAGGFAGGGGGTVASFLGGGGGTFPDGEITGPTAIVASANKSKFPGLALPAEELGCPGLRHDNLGRDTSLGDEPRVGWTRCPAS